MRKYTYIIFIVTIAMLMALPAMAQQDQVQESGGDSGIFRKNVSKTPEMASAKAKLNIMPVWFPARTADDEELTEPIEYEYYNDDGGMIGTREATEAKPLVIVYTDVTYDDNGNEYADVFAAISRDDGSTWKRKNVSMMADKSSFTLDEGNGEAYYGHCKKPVFQVKGNQIFIAWSSKYAKGGTPRYTIDPEEDIWGVSGSQGSHDYMEETDGEVGEIPYSAVWTVRGIIATQDDVDNGLGEFVGDIVWFTSERLTSARRDAYQLFVGGADNAGFGVIWQEDPEGIRPGKEVGPGHGWSGATTSHKTDIWYSYITWGEFAQVDDNFVSGGAPEHDLAVVERPKALVPMSLPVRISDNDVVNLKNLDPITGDGSHRYGEDLCPDDNDFFTFINQSDDETSVCVTDGRLLDGDTGASRPNLFLQPYQKPDGSKSAWAIVAYEETKGLGAGPPDHDSGQPEEGGSGNDVYVPDEGKNVIYHSFDFQDPETVSAGHILNLPVTDADGNLVYVTETDNPDDLKLDYLDQRIVAYENARRPRFVLQGKTAAGDTNTTMLVLYKQGVEGMGRASDIMLRRCVAPENGNPYAFKNFVCDKSITVDGEEICIGAQNVSSVSPSVTDPADPGVLPEDAPYGAVKVLEWSQDEGNLTDPSWLNPYDDARAHRGQIRGDFVVIGFTWTPNWAAARNYHDKYDFYIRRSFDGGETWTESLNVSMLPNNKETVIEPRIVAVPGSIKDRAESCPTPSNPNKLCFEFPEDKQNKNVFYLSYGLAMNDDSGAPTDLYWSVSNDQGETLYSVTNTISTSSPNYIDSEDGEYYEGVNDVEGWDWLAKDKDAEEGEAQLRMTPDGSRFYAAWLTEGEDGSDIWFRRIMPPTFPLPAGFIPLTEIFQTDELVDEAWTFDLLGVEPGDSIFYSMTITNIYDEIMELSISDELDSLVSYKPGLFDWEVDGQTLSYEGNLAPTATLDLTFEVIVSDIAELGETISNAMTITWEDLDLVIVSNTVLAEVVPEPSTLILLGLGVLGLLGFARKKRNRKQ